MQLALTTPMHGVATFRLMPRVAKKPKSKKKLLRNYVAQYRTRAGMENQSELAEAVGVSQTTISRIEAHEVTITDANLQAIAGVFGLPDPLLLYASPEVADMVVLARQLGSRDLREVTALIRAKLENQAADEA